MQNERTPVQRVSLWMAILIFSVFAASPFLCMIITTFKDSADLYRKANNPFIYNRPPTTELTAYHHQRRPEHPHPTDHPD